MLSRLSAFGLSFSFTGLAGLEADSGGSEPMSNLCSACFRPMFSGVASLSGSRSGDFGVSPADESSISLFSFRGVLYRLFHAGTGGRGLLGEDRSGWLEEVGREWLVLDFEGELNVLCVPNDAPSVLRTDEDASFE